MKLIVAIIAISIFASIRSQYTDLRCNPASADLLDIYTQKLYLVGSPDRLYPTNAIQLRKFCRETKQMASYVKNYTNQCADKSSRQVINLAMYSLNKEYENMCKSVKRKSEFLKMGNCANAAKPATIPCFENMIRNIDSIQYESNHKMKIPFICCSYVYMRQCNLKAYESRRECSRRASEGLDNMVAALGMDVMRFLCGDYSDENDKCDQIRNRYPRKNSKYLPKSPLTPFIKVMETIP